MKIAHFSDTHLGYSRYARTNERGLNQRMVDVVETFQRVLDSILESEAEVVIHAGDFFDSIRPQNLIITGAFKRLSAFQRAREGKPLIIIAGNHDSPKSIGIGNILTIFGDHDGGEYSIPGVYVVESRARRIVLPDFKFEALALPWKGEESFEGDLRPQSRQNTCVLIAHGVEQTLPLPGPTLSLSRMNYTEWDYVALGDYHIRKPLAGENGNVWYSGSTEYTSTNYWEEADVDKGWNLFDSETGDVKFKGVEPARWVRTLDPIDAKDMSGEDIGAQMLRNANWDVSALPIIKQLVINCNPVARAEIPAEALDELRSRCLFYDFKPLLESNKGVDDGEGNARAATLQDDWDSFAYTRPLPLGVDRNEFVETGHKVMKEAGGDSQED